MSCFFFFFNDTATTEIYPLPLHDALPIYGRGRVARRRARDGAGRDLSAALGECLLPPGPPLAARRGGDLGGPAAAPAARSRRGAVRGVARASHRRERERAVHDRGRQALHLP